jgi:sulfopyruvate decarboxylase subunit beta
MKRAEALQSVVDIIGDAPCFITVGLTWSEWNKLRGTDGNFHLKTLGSGSSVGLGLASAMPHRKIVVFDGDGAVIMNVNGLITIGRVRPKNLVHIVFDNKIYESSACIPTATAHNADLLALATGAGIVAATRVNAVGTFKAAVSLAMTNDGPHFIVADVEPSGEDANTSYSRIDEVDGKFRFIRYLESIEGRKLREDAIDVKMSIR